MQDTPNADSEAVIEALDWEDERRRKVRHHRALDLADEMCGFADMVPGWGSTASKLRQAASSLRWQVNWEHKHPPVPIDRSGTV